MARYLEVAAEANVVAKQLLDCVPRNDIDRAYAAELIARLVNLGVRVSPRGVQHTVRYNAVKRAVQDLPIKVTMEERKDERTGRSYHVLITQREGSTALTVESLSDD